MCSNLLSLLLYLRYRVHNVFCLKLYFAYWCQNQRSQEFHREILQFRFSTELFFLENTVKEIRNHMLRACRDATVFLFDLSESS